MLYDFTNDVYTYRALYRDEKGCNKKSAGCAYKCMKEDLEIIKYDKLNKDIRKLYKKL